MEHFGQRIRATLESSDNLTQKGLASACGVSKSAVTQWVNEGTKNIRPSHLFSAADYLGVDPRWLAVGKSPDNSEPAGIRESPAQYLGETPARLDRLMREEKRPRSAETAALMDEVAKALDFHSGDARALSATALVLIQFERMASQHHNELSNLRQLLDKAQADLDRCHQSLSRCRKEKAALSPNKGNDKGPRKPIL